MKALWDLIVLAIIAGGALCLVVGLFAPERLPPAPPKPPPLAARESLSEVTLQMLGGLAYLASLPIILLVWLSPLLILAWLVLH